MLFEGVCVEAVEPRAQVEGQPAHRPLILPVESEIAEPRSENSRRRQLCERDRHLVPEHVRDRFRERPVDVVDSEDGVRPALNACDP